MVKNDIFIKEWNISPAPTKNGEIRVVSMGAGLAQVLRELRLQRGGERYVLPRSKEWEHGRAASILRSFQRDIGIRETNFHSIRASYITHMLLKGVPVTKVQQLIGHKDLKTTMKYVRLLGTEIIGASDVIDVNVDELGSGGNVVPIKKTE